MKAGNGRALGLIVVTGAALTGCSNGSPGAGEAAGPDPSGAATVIEYRQFSGSPSLARGQGAPDPRDPDYGALAIFTERVRAKTAALGEGRDVAFALQDGGATFADVAAEGRDAVHVAGGSLNGTWGFLYNSVPFGPTFAEMADFLHEGGGVELVNRIFRERDVDVVALPVVGSPEQASGYFLKPVGVPQCAPGDRECAAFGEGIGLSGLCAEPWTLRYLPPAETIVARACDELEGPRRLSFVQAIPGGSAFLTAVQQGAIDGFEFATPLDDYDAEKGGFFAHPESPDGSDGRNVGEIGLRFVHHPGWHQPFYLGWLVINRSRVWDALDEEQQHAVEEAAREALAESFAASSSLQCDHLRQILAINEGRSRRGPDGEAVEGSAAMVLTRWRDDDLARLRAAAGRVLESTGTNGSDADRADYETILGALLDHLGHSSIGAMLDAWTGPGGSYDPATCAAG